MTDPMHLSSFVPGALNELLAMIEKGERAREKDGEQKEVDLQLQFPFDLSMSEQETSLHNPENYNERTETKS
tara:strand:- start:20 stop:235 length:216 start_codon:yes stop_codon:yes gene_type:complete